MNDYLTDLFRAIADQERATQGEPLEVLRLLLEIMSQGYFVRLTASRSNEPSTIDRERDIRQEVTTFEVAEPAVMFTAVVGHAEPWPMKATKITHPNALGALEEAYRHHRDEWAPRKAGIEIKRCAKCGSEASVFHDEDRFPWHCHCSTVDCYGLFEVSGMKRQDVIDRWNKAQSK